MKLLTKTSGVTLLIIAFVLSIYRISTINEKEIAWDILGYYLPLPATFVHDDPALNNVDWLKKVNEERDLTGTLYMVSSNDEGEPMYFFLLGMSILYLPFFLIGHGAAYLADLPMDGFSMPYQYALVFGAILYTIIGLVFFRKILREFFSEKISSIVLIITVFSTNYIHHLTLKNLETVNYLFMLLTIIVWFTIKWHKTQKLSSLIIISVSTALMALVKPSEIVIVLIPLLWNVTSKETACQKLKLIVSYKKHFFIAIAAAIVVVSPQVIYWLVKTGSPLYDSYKNPGVGLDIFSPHIFNSLFSYRKGWLIYTPTMIFFLWGLRVMYLQNKKIFFPIAIYFFTTFYIIVSWSEWWYGAGFSNRPIITTYPILAIGFGYFLVELEKKKSIYKGMFLLVVLLFTALNQFQWWQLKNYILDPSRTTKDYYWATFLKTSASDSDRELLSIKRDFTGAMNFNNPEDYRSVYKNVQSFDKDKNKTKDLNTGTYNVKEEEEYALTNKLTYDELTQKYHAWVTISFDLKFPAGFEGQWPCMVMTMDRRGGNYGYFAPEIKPDNLNENWVHYSFNYLTPEIRDREDELKYFIWKRGAMGFEIENFSIEVFEEK
jgi:hypothetical protein